MNKAIPFRSGALAAALLVAVALLAASPAAAQSPAAGKTTRTISFETSEGTQLVFDISPDGSTIVFDLLNQLWTLPVAGGEPVALTDAVADAAADVSPSFSPDGRRVAFHADRPGGWGLFVVPAEGGPAVRLTGGAEFWTEPAGAAWSPDGRRLALVRDRQVQILDVESSELTALELVDLPAPAAPARPVWTPDGSRIAFSSGGALWWVDAAGGPVEALAEQGGTPRFSPDGSTLAYVSRDEDGRLQLWIRETAGGKARQLTTHEDLTGHPRWTPDGNAILYAADGRIQRVAVDEDTPAALEVPFTARVELERHEVTPTGMRMAAPGEEHPARGFYGLALAPAGDRIAMLALGRLWVFAPGETPRAVAQVPTTADGLAWSPDGREVAWSAGPGGAHDLFATDVQTGAIRRLTRLPGHAMRPSWSPDGERIAWAYWDKAVLDTPPWDYSDAIERLMVTPARGLIVTRAEDALDLGPVRVNWHHRAFTAPMEQLQWSADGTRIFVADGQQFALVDLAGERQPMAVGEYPMTFAQWLPDGTIAMVDNTHLWSVELDLSEHRLGARAPISDDPAMYLTAARDGSLLYLSSDGIRLRRPDGVVQRLGWPLSFRAPPAPTPLLIRSARVIRGDGSPPLPPQDVLIRNGRIASLGPAGSLATLPGDVQVIEAGGRTLMPGLIEAHAHLWDDPVLPGMLYAGITTARDLGAPIARVAASRDDVEAGVRQGPRLVFGGFQWIGGETPFTGVTVHAAEGDEGRARSIAIMKGLGAEHLKMRQFNDWASGTRLIAAARDEGWPVSGHIAMPLPLVAAGIAGLEHLGPSGTRTNLILYDDIVQLFRAAGIWVAPTAAAYAQVPRVIDEPELLDAPDTAPFLSPLFRWWVTRFPAARGADYARFAELSRLGAARLHEGGVAIVAGSDAPGLPWALHWEMEELAAAGLSPLEAITAATGNSARALGLDSEIGTIEVGKQADLLLLDADPLQDIRNTQKIWKVIQGGRVVDREALLEWARESQQVAITDELERERIVAVIAAFARAREEANWNALRETVHPEWKAVSPSGRVYSLEEYIRGMASLSDLQVEMFDTSVRVSADGSMAWATFTSELRHHYQGGKPRGAAPGYAGSGKGRGPVVARPLALRSAAAEMRISTLLCVIALAAASAWPAAAAGQVACDDLLEPGIPRVVISSVEESPRDVARGWPARCTVSGALDGRIRFVLHLPAADAWNGRFLMGGGGGFGGVVANQALSPGLRGGDALQRGFATIGTDTGHRGTGLDASWAVDNWHGMWC
jgi:Tol biopolymer transport system component